MDYKIVIPSLGRADILCERTLPLLLEFYEIEPSNIFVFVVENEYLEYRNKIDENNKVNVIVGVKGIAQQRAFISNYFEEGQFILSLDDDIRRISELEGDKLFDLKSLKDLIKIVKEIFLETESACCGVYPTNNPFFMSQMVTSNLKFLIGAMRFYLNDREIETNTDYSLLEDYNKSILYYKKYKTISRLNYITIDHDCNGKLKGGLSSINDRSYHYKALEVQKFQENFKLYCSVNDRYTAKGRKIDIRFRKCRNNSN
jgi:hypothetical protein